MNTYNLTEIELTELLRKQRELCANEIVEEPDPTKNVVAEACRELVMDAPSPPLPSGAKKEDIQLVPSIENYGVGDKGIRQHLESRINQLNEADAHFCDIRWGSELPIRSSLARQLAREESNKVTFARQELQEVLKLLSKEQEPERSVATKMPIEPNPDPQSNKKEPVIQARKIVSEWLKKNNTAVTLDGRFGGEFDANDLANTIKPYLKSKGEPVIDWENLEGACEEWCHNEFTKAPCPEKVFNWLKSNLPNYIKPE